MLIKILVTATYGNPRSDPSFRAIELKAGDLFEVPEWYGNSLINRKMAEEAGEPVSPPTLMPLTPQPLKASEYKPRRRK